jgi:hypothetical protein
MATSRTSFCPGIACTSFSLSASFER